MKKFVSTVLCCVLLSVCTPLAGCSNSTVDTDTINALRDRIEQLEAEAETNQNALQDKITQLEAEAETNQAELSQLSAAIQTLHTSIAALQTSGQANTDAIAVLETKVEALEGVSALYGQRLDALESSSDTYATDISALQQDLSDLTAQVVNAQYVERTVITKAEVANSDIITDLTANMSGHPVDGKMTISGRLTFELALNYQLYCFNITLQINSKEYLFEIFADNTSRGDKDVHKSLATNIVYDDSFTIIKDKLNVVIYRFN